MVYANGTCARVILTVAKRDCRMTSMTSVAEVGIRRARSVTKFRLKHFDYLLHLTHLSYSNHLNCLNRPASL